MNTSSQQCVLLCSEYIVRLISVFQHNNTLFIQLLLFYVIGEEKVIRMLWFIRCPQRCWEDVYADDLPVGYRGVLDLHCTPLLESAVLVWWLVASWKHGDIAKFDVFATVVTSILAFWDMTPYRLVPYLRMRESLSRPCLYAGSNLKTWEENLTNFVSRRMRIFEFAMAVTSGISKMTRRNVPEYRSLSVLSHLGLCWLSAEWVGKLYLCWTLAQIWTASRVFSLWRLTLFSTEVVRTRVHPS